MQVFTSGDLPVHWDRLDAFEGVEYARVLIDVDLAGKTVTAQLYALKPEP